MPHGVVTDDIIRSLSISQRKLRTREVIVMQHTQCGLATFTEDEFKDELENDTGLRPTWSLETFRDVEASVRTSVARVRHTPFILHTDQVRGFVYDVCNGSLTEVDMRPCRITHPFRLMSSYMGGGKASSS